MTYRHKPLVDKRKIPRTPDEMQEQMDAVNKAFDHGFGFKDALNAMDFMDECGDR